MNIKIDSLEFMHNLLRHPPSDTGEPLPGDEWRYGTGLERRRSLPFPFQYIPLKLPEPLDDFTVGFKWFGNNYSCSALIDAVNPKVFRNTYGRLRGRIEGKGYKFLPHRRGEGGCDIIDNSTGKIFKNGEFLFDIRSANKGILRVISMGTGGTCPKFITDDETAFIKEVRTLEVLVNMFIDCLLEPFSDREDVKAFRETPCYLNP